MNEIRHLTKYIINGGILLNTSILHQIKDSAKPKDLCYKSATNHIQTVLRNLTKHYG